MGIEIQTADMTYPQVHIRKVKLLKSPKFDLGALLSLHGESDDRRPGPEGGAGVQGAGPGECLKVMSFEVVSRIGQPRQIVVFWSLGKEKSS